MATKTTISSLLNKQARRTVIGIMATVCGVLFSCNVSALGLGALEVRSNLDQPLSATIELRVAPGDDIGSVSAQIASRDDFERLGVDYPAYLQDLNLTVENMGGGDYVLRVVSNDVIIKEPFIHFLVRVDWSGGSFLREYTALIDPPVYAAQAPTSLSEPKVVGTDQSYSADIEPDLAAQDIDESASTTETYEEPEYEAEADYAEDPYAEPTEVEPTEYSEQAEVVDEVFSQPQTTSTDEPGLPTDAKYGPVVSGESLSVIAQELQRQFPDLSIYQIMQVLFDENNEAFINGNINGLMAGAVLSIGDLNAIRQVDVAAAKQFFYDQLSEWDPSVLTASSAQTDYLVGQDSYTGQDESLYNDSIANTGVDDYSSASTEPDYASTETAFQVGASTEIDPLVSSGEGDSRAGEVLALQQQVSELEAALSSSNLENQELTERISLLEGQLADVNRLLSMDVESADMAAVESALQAQNEASSDLADTGLDSDPMVDSLAETADSALAGEVLGGDDESVNTDNGFIDPLAELEGFSAEDGVELESTDTAASVSEIAADDSANAVSASAEDEVQSAPVAVAATPAKSDSFLSGLKSSIVDGGLWKILAAVAALILGGIGLWFVRRRRADHEFEISMMSIESSSLAAEKEVSVPEVVEDKAKGKERETSFLTVYSDSDAVVQADEVDPVAEADVYIAYGRDEQAEEVLLDGIASNPARVDIKQKLLTLYHKNNNVEGFERIAEELYSQKNFLTRNVWQEVSLMGKDLSPENPLFDVSSAELLASSDDADDGMVTSGDSLDRETSMLDGDTTVSVEASSSTQEPDTSADTAAQASEEGEEKFDEKTQSVNLINFDDDNSALSELDDVNFEELELRTEAILEETSKNDLSTPVLANTDDVVDDVVDDDDVEDNTIDDVEDDVIAEDEDSTFEIDFASPADEAVHPEAVHPEAVRPEADHPQAIHPEADHPQAVQPEDSEEDVAAIDEDELQMNDSVRGAQSDRDVEQQRTAEVSDLEIGEDYDEARTQYELAKVFVDLGDEDGARKILDEIVANQDNNQDVLDDAGKLLASINT